MIDLKQYIEESLMDSYNNIEERSNKQLVKPFTNFIKNVLNNPSNHATYMELFEDNIKIYSTKVSKAPKTPVRGGMYVAFGRHLHDPNNPSTCAWVYFDKNDLNKYFPELKCRRKNAFFGTPSDNPHYPRIPTLGISVDNGPGDMDYEQYGYEVRWYLVDKNIIKDFFEVIKIYKTPFRNKVEMEEYIQSL